MVEAWQLTIGTLADEGGGGPGYTCNAAWNSKLCQVLGVVGVSPLSCT